MKKQLVVHAIGDARTDDWNILDNLCNGGHKGHSIRGCYAGDCSDSRHRKITCRHCLKKLQKEKKS